MSKYIIRLDDASEKRDVGNWNRMEKLLDSYGIKPLVGVIPDCQDPMMEHYPIDQNFWTTVYEWQKKDWTIAMHGYQHLYTAKCGGVNPVNDRSEFAGDSLESQQRKIRSGISIFEKHGIYPKVFFAPSHTFDINTVKALKSESKIRIISDTIAFDTYYEYGITFVPQQSGKVRRLPFRVVTFCYHPNTMNDKDFEILESFIKKYSNRFSCFPVNECHRRRTFFDKLLRFFYFARR